MTVYMQRASDLQVAAAGPRVTPGTIDFTGVQTPISIPPNVPCKNLLCDGTRLRSFSGLRVPPGVEVFSCRRAPLAGYRFLPVMASIVFGRSLRKVNGITLNRATLSTASALAPLVRDDLLCGWIIENVDPLKLLNLDTRKRRTLLVDRTKAPDEPDDIEEIDVFEAPQFAPPKLPVRRRTATEDGDTRKNFEALNAGILKDIVAGRALTRHQAKEPAKAPRARAKSPQRCQSALSE
jgi:hypothetical protein